MSDEGTCVCGCIECAPGNVERLRAELSAARASLEAANQGMRRLCEERGRALDERDRLRAAVKSALSCLGACPHPVTSADCSCGYALRALAQLDAGAPQEQEGRRNDAERLADEVFGPREPPEGDSPVFVLEGGRYVMHACNGAIRMRSVGQCPWCGKTLGGSTTGEGGDRG